ncbi:hypothetical protein ASD8599_04050 [Ascidiaceihabitans donghaensis]|uniref:Beta-barrel assembly-enhancing protease n=1 Tax=Ascidiaceihabitans donghaensis TaxID=1510460 RepID=A0A2R8BPP7_9RHOB|nr:hypothetical protein [Ascidiaceihabitans donghaensis]SPH27584.1 hypothetical protein ASD8599_04050 [Ascidiaceihabitans donghaensis]
MRFLVSMVLVLAMSTAAVAQTLTAQDVLDRFDAEIDDKGALRMDAYLTQSLREAKAQGTLKDPLWARVMLVNGVLILSGLARYERGMGLLDEGAALAKQSGDTDTRDAILSYMAYYHAWFGNDAAAQAIVAQMAVHPLDVLIEPERNELRTLLDAPVAPNESPGFTRATELMRESSDVFETGDYEQATSLLRGLRMPPPLDDDPMVRVSNAIQSAMMAIYAQVQGDNQAGQHYDTAFHDLVDPKSTAPALRPELLNDPAVRDLLASAISILAANTAADSPRGILLQRWMTQASDGLAAQADLNLETRIRHAREARQWDRAANLSLQALDADGLDLEDRLRLEADVQILRAKAAIQRGAAIDHDALTTAFVNVFNEDSMQIFARSAIASEILVTFDQAGHFHLANIVGVALHDWVQALSRRADQSGEAISVQAQYWRNAGSLTVQTGFDAMLSPLDGSEGPPGLCQDIIGIEVCTAVLQLPQ